MARVAARVTDKRVLKLIRAFLKSGVMEVGHSCRDARHQAVVIDPVEEFFEIKVNYDAVARGNVSLRLGYCLMGGAPRSEAVTVAGKHWVPALLKNLQQGLLDQSVDDARHAELSDPAIRLGDFNPFDRLAGLEAQGIHPRGYRRCSASRK